VGVIKTALTKKQRELIVEIRQLLKQHYFDPEEISQARGSHSVPSKYQGQNHTLCSDRELSTDG
jgi:hypothetical protein